MHDYIIVGAGSAGCVLANRLSENPDTTVLLLEAGGTDSQPDILIPSHWPMLMGTALDWQYTTAPQRHMNNRASAWPRGKVLGGTSSINAMMYVRGNRYDYDRWAEAGNQGWSYTDVLPYFRKSEHQQRGGSDYHGTGGLLYVSDPVEIHPFAQALVKAATEIGLPLNDDFNGAEQEGIGIGQVSQKDGQRHSTAAAFLRPALHRPNLTVETGVQVTRLLLHEKHVTGVDGVQNGEAREFAAGREVILCGGAVNSPQILMLSGIGSADHLREHSIPVVVDLPGVGQNLQDHVYVVVSYRATQNIPLHPASVLGEVDGFLKTRPDVPAPDLQMFGGAGFLNSNAEQPVFGLNLALLRPESRGSISLTSGDPLAHPLIQPNYLDSETDMQVLLEGIKIARRTGQAAAMDSFRAGEDAPGESVQSDEALRAYIRETASTMFHPVGTCKMGHDALAVVNDRLEVHGVAGLRVVDASIMPTIISGNTNAPTIMIAEKAADLIRG